MNLNRVMKHVIKERNRLTKAKERKGNADAAFIQAVQAAGVNFVERKGQRVQVEDHPTRTVDLSVLNEFLPHDVVDAILKVQTDLRKFDAAVKIGTIPEEVADKATKVKVNTQVRVYGDKVREEVDA